MKQMKKKSAMKVTIIISIIFVISFVVSQFMSFGDKTEELTYNDFIQMVENKEVDNIQINLNNDTFLVEDNNGKTYITDNPKYSNFKKDIKQLIILII